ncbi:MAG: CDP-glycerol glycerophosphotransferase family protein [Burkholderiales bacterium]|nr:CDP-glycerol glycerophosphotransferase family protein [Burkholderiales bacterium]
MSRIPTPQDGDTSALLTRLDQQQLATDFAQLSRSVRKRPLVLFFGRNAFSDNSKYLYLRAVAASRGYEVHWATFDRTLTATLQGLGLPVIRLGADIDASIDTLLHAAVAIYTVNPIESLGQLAPLLGCLAGAKQLQLWHGISVKRLTLQLLPHLSARATELRQPWISSTGVDHVVSTAPAFDAYWREVFGCRHLVRAGLPRNEVILRQASDLEMVGARLPDAVLPLLQDSAPALLLMPTWQRGKPTPLTDPGFLRRAEAWGRAQGAHLFLKAHPSLIGRDCGLSGVGSHLHLLDTALDIYPWLFRFNALVTDYSSVMFDHLLSGHPVLTLDLADGQHQRFEPDYSLVPPGDYRYDFSAEGFEDVWLRALLDDPLRAARQAYAREIFASDPAQACDDLLRVVDRLVEQATAPDWQVWQPAATH